MTPMEALGGKVLTDDQNDALAATMFKMRIIMHRSQGLVVCGVVPANDEDIATCNAHNIVAAAEAARFHKRARLF